MESTIPTLTWNFKRSVQYCGAVVFTVALIVLFGWVFNLPFLKSVAPGWITMKVNTALGFIVLSSALILRSRYPTRPLTRILLPVLTGLAIIGGILTLYEYLAHQRLFIDEFLITDPDGKSGLFPPGRPAPMTAMAFICLALAIVCENFKSRKNLIVIEGLALLVIVVATRSVLSYVFDLHYEFGNAFYMQMALHTSLNFILLSVGILLLNPEEGFISALRSKTVAGNTGRTLMFAVVIIPPLVRWVVDKGIHYKLFDADFASLLRLIGSTSFLSTVIWRDVLALYKIEVERRRYESSIKAANQELESRVQSRTQQLLQANQELEAFSYSVSHDLRAPLRAIAGFGQLLTDDHSKDLNEEGLDYLKRVRTATLKMDSIIDALLKLSQLSRQKISRAEINLSEIAKRISLDLRGEEPKRESVFNIEDNLRAHCDRELITIVLTNLIRNSWKYSAKKPKTLIAFGSEHRDGKTIFFVRDNGVGFDMTYVSKLFGAFQRLHGDREFEGTGIGLATVRRIMNGHGGNVWAEAVPNEGATFFFHF